jgi:hypothetical protein
MSVRFLYLVLCGCAVLGAFRMANQLSGALDVQQRRILPAGRGFSGENDSNRSVSAEPTAVPMPESPAQSSSEDDASPAGDAVTTENTSAGADRTPEELSPIPLSMDSHPIRHRARLHPQMITPGNFEYQGAFRPPHARINGTTFAYGGWALAYRADGDPSGADDVTPGSLFIVGHKTDQKVAEISIPRPVVSPLQRMDDLPVAEVLQPFDDLTDGILDQMNVGSATPFQIGGMLVLGDRIHWTIHKYYNVDGRDFPSHGTSSVTLQRPRAEGPWHLGPMNSGVPEWHSYKHAGYIFQIPEPDASAWFRGNNLISGLQISTGLQYSSQGPAMFAYRLPPAGTPVNTSLKALPLAWYSEEVPLATHHPSDRWIGAAWMTLGEKSAVVVIGRKALGEFYYGEARPGDCTQDKGYHGRPYEVEALFYSPASLIQAAHGKLPAHSLQPWLRWDHQFDGGSLSQYMFSTCSQDVGGVTWDPERKLLYLVQISAGFTGDNEFEPLPVIHVFRIAD